MRTLLLTAALVLLFDQGGGSEREERRPEPVTIAYIGDSVDSVAARMVMEEAYRRLGIEVELRSYQASEALEASNGGEVDAELQRIDGTHLRFENLVQVPIPINYLQGLAFSSGLDFPIEGWNSLEPYRVGIVGGILFAEQGTRGMDVRVARNYPELVRWIAGGEVQAGVMPRISGLVALRDEGEEEVQPMEGVLETLLLYHYVHSSRAELVPDLARELKAMLLDGTTQGMRERAYGELLGDER
jgi:hypothetical protein